MIFSDFEMFIMLFCELLSFWNKFFISSKDNFTFFGDSNDFYGNCLFEFGEDSMF